MKKVVSIILSALMVLVMLAGCSEKEEVAELLTYTSSNGYTVSYTDAFEPTELSSDIDFVVMDTNTGSVVTIQTMRDSIDGYTEKSFEDEMEKNDMDIKVTSFGYETINGNNALVVAYTYNENTITQVMYDAGSKTYNAMYTELPGADNELRETMTAIIRSITY